MFNANAGPGWMLRFSLGAPDPSLPWTEAGCASGAGRRVGPASPAAGCAGAKLRRD